MIDDCTCSLGLRNNNKQMVHMLGLISIPDAEPCNEYGFVYDQTWMYRNALLQ